MPRRRTRLLLAALLPAALASGCRIPARGLRAAVSDPFAPAVADIQTWGGRVWFVERTQELSSYAAELAQRVPLQFQRQRRLRFFVLSGRARVRLAGEEAVLAAGSFVSVPKRTAYRILPLEGPAPRLLMVLMPDGEDPTLIEVPAVTRRLLARDRP